MSDQRPEPTRTGGSVGGLSRRRALRLCGVAGVAALAGCTEDVGEELPANTKWPVSELKPALPVTERTDVLEERIEAMAEREIDDVDAFADAFEEYALEVESVEETEDVLTIEYVNTKLYEEGNLHDIGPIAGAYAALVDAGHGSDVLGITILDAAPASFGSASIDGAWAQRYNEDELTAKEYGELVAGTVESKRHPPEVGVSPDE
ncbi:hypothetical protein [Natrononativus amylolyticus]|uniref:hypothetical protein n=1 Tax=Natrononativus amylolyticus TaxID=2963434 RepID=UPI0020CC5660|nr:hypothetical protein [Natrononativus amylolyticus]